MNGLLQDGLSKFAEQPDSSVAYDELLWTIVTSPISDLSELISNPWENAYSQLLPIPLFATAARLVITSVSAENHVAIEAKGWLAAHCDPYQEKGALDGSVF